MSTLVVEGHGQVPGRLGDPVSWLTKVLRGVENLNVSTRHGCTPQARHTFAQRTGIDIDFPMPLHQSPGTYRYVVSVAATETCGTDPSKTLTAAATKEIKVQKPGTHPPGQPAPKLGVQKLGRGA